MLCEKHSTQAEVIELCSASRNSNLRRSYLLKVKLFQQYLKHRARVIVLFADVFIGFPVCQSVRIL